MAPNTAQSARTRSLQPSLAAIHVSACTASNAHSRQKLGLVRRAAVSLCSLLLLVVVALTAPLPGTASGMHMHSSRTKPDVDTGLLPSTVHERVHDLEELSADSSGSVSHRRHLLTPNPHFPWTYPTCPNCKYYGCSWSGTLKLGHCKRFKMRKLHTFHCEKRKNSAFVGVEPHMGFRGNATGDSQEEIVDALFAVGEGNSTVLIRGIACFEDNDCMLSADGFAAVGGAVPESRGGFLTASCLRGGGVVGAESTGRATDAEAGICLCQYRNSTVVTDDSTFTDNSTSTSSSSASVSTRVASSMGGRSSGSGASRSLLQGSVSVSTRAVATSETFEDLCVQIPLPDTGEISASRLGVVVADSDLTTGGNSAVNLTEVIEEAVVGNSTDVSVELDADFQLAPPLFSGEEEDNADDGGGGTPGSGTARASGRANATGDEFDISIRLEEE